MRLLGLVSVKRQARAEVMRVERERQVEAKRRAGEEEAAQMEAERQAATMKLPLKFSLRLCPIKISLKFSFRLCKIDFPSSSVSD